MRAIIPALTEYVRRDSQSELNMSALVLCDADCVRCAIHLLQTGLRNLLYNAVRYARHEVHMTFTADSGVNTLLVDDDGPGIPEQEWVRVLDSFVALDASNMKRTNAGFGLGLAIGEVLVARSPFAGARIVATWPSR